MAEQIVGFAHTDYCGLLTDAPPRYAPLEANVFYLQGEGSRALVVALDLMQISREFSAEVRAALASRLGLAAEEVVSHCTHAHSTPDENALREVGAEALAERIAPAARGAIRSAKPALVELIEERVRPRANVCRRQRVDEVSGAFTIWTGFSMVGDRPDGGPVVRERLFRLLGREPSLEGPVWYERPVDDLAQLIVFRSPDGARAPVGAILRFSAHAVASGHCADRSWGGDFPCFARETIRRDIRAPCVFLTGPCGDIAPAERCDWKVEHEPGSPGPFIPRGYPTSEAAAAEAKRQGEEIAGAVLASSRLGKGAEPLERVACSVRRVELAIRESILESADEAREAKKTKWEALESARSEGAGPAQLKGLADAFLHCSYMPAMHEEWYYASPDEIRARRFVCELPRIELNDILIAGFPGEVCQGATFSLRKALARPVVTVTEMNGDAGYMSPAEDFPDGDYEVNCSIITEDGLRALWNAHCETG